ncbi:hypothetical protein R69888_03507 [Paraburkholderia haematera]|uniref:Uncharacterized protein n=1 Tax=Paraburkholderia haematera TaxID=2793077 RepID=A0ABN7LVW2_9BURK|nr:hypothetical protein R69888_03507 [Paraburkholderia haematera]
MKSILLLAATERSAEKVPESGSIYAFTRPATLQRNETGPAARCRASTARRRSNILPQCNMVIQETIVVALSVSGTSSQVVPSRFA